MTERQLLKHLHSSMMADTNGSSHVCNFFFISAWQFAERISFLWIKFDGHVEVAHCSMVANISQIRGQLFQVLR